MRNGAHVLTSCYYWQIGIDSRTLAVIIQIRRCGAKFFFRDSGAAFIGESGVHLESNYSLSAGIARILKRQLSERALKYTHFEMSKVSSIKVNFQNSGQFLYYLFLYSSEFGMYESKLLWSRKRFFFSRQNTDFFGSSLARTATPPPKLQLHDISWFYP